MQPDTLHESHLYCSRYPSRLSKPPRLPSTAENEWLGESSKKAAVALIEAGLDDLSLSEDSMDDDDDDDAAVGATQGGFPRLATMPSRGKSSCERSTWRRRRCTASSSS